MIDSVLYWIVRVLGAVLCALPPSVAIALGRFFGRLAYWAQPERQAVCLANLKAAFQGERSVQELDFICRQVFENMGMSFVEMLRTPVLDLDYVERHITVCGKEHLDSALALGRGVVVVTAHFGNWELIGLTAGLRGYPSSVLARQQGMPRLNRLLNSYRESKGCRVISKGMAVRQVVKRLKEKGMVAILADQDGGKRGILAPFFGRIASTAQGPIAFGRKLGSPVLPIFIVRENGLQHTIHIEPPIAIPSTESVEEDIRLGIGRYLGLLERMIRKYPDQWLWLHRRWKSSPTQSVIALSDGKAGHRTQAEAVAGIVEQVWNERFSRDLRPGASTGPQAKNKTIEIKFRSLLHRFFLITAYVSGIVALVPAWQWLRWTLTPPSYKALEEAWAGVVVSCGTSTALVSAVWSRSIGARKIHVMRPPWVCEDDFQLKVIPRHDRPSQDDRTVVTEGALHGLDAAELAAAMARQRKLWSLGRPLQIGFLVGGDAGFVRLPPDTVEVVSKQLILAAKKAEADLLVVGSRRTSPALEFILENRFDQHERCPMLVLVSRDSAPGYVQGVLAAANVIVVSGDSMSMVSEAASSGKPVVVFKPKTFVPLEKHIRFLDSLFQQGFISIEEPDRICSRVLEILQSKHPARSMNDRIAVLDRLQQWL